MHSSSGSKILKRTATFGKAGELSDMLCVCHSPYEQLCYAGSATGEIYVFQGSTFRKRMPAHKGAVYAMFAILQSDDKVQFYCSSSAPYALMRFGI